LSEQVGMILEHASKLGEVATEDIPPTASAIPRSNVLRPDEVEPSLPQDEALGNAPDQEDGRFRVPRITEMEA
jgi:aspartyl-tRNA(Asn)/glutamyl-tRNA(Gln) amidotransferase subunit C